MPKRVIETAAKAVGKQVRNLAGAAAPKNQAAARRASGERYFDIVNEDGTDYAIDEFRRRLYGSDN